MATEQVDVKLPSGETVTTEVPAGMEDDAIKGLLRSKHPEMFRGTTPDASTRAVAPVPIPRGLRPNNLGSNSVLGREYARTDPSSRPSSMAGLAGDIAAGTLTAGQAMLTGGDVATSGPVAAVKRLGTGLVSSYLGAKGGRFAAKELGGGETAQSVAGIGGGLLGGMAGEFGLNSMPMRKIAGEMAGKISPTLGDVIGGRPTVAVHGQPVRAVGSNLGNPLPDFMVAPIPGAPAPGVPEGSAMSMPRELLPNRVMSRMPGADKAIRAAGTRLIYDPGPVIGTK